jgi:hypothetical protein
VTTKKCFITLAPGVHPEHGSDVPDLGRLPGQGLDDGAGRKTPDVQQNWKEMGKIKKYSGRGSGNPAKNRLMSLGSRCKKRVFVHNKLSLFKKIVVSRLNRVYY